MTVVLVVFIYQYFFATPKKVTKKTVAKDEFLPMIRRRINVIGYLFVCSNKQSYNYRRSESIERSESTLSTSLISGTNEGVDSDFR